MSKLFDGRLHHPSSILISGGTGSGKSTWVERLIDNLDLLMDTKIERIIWYYAHPQPMFTKSNLKHVEFVQGFNMDAYRDDKGPTIVVIDDQMAEVAKIPSFVNAFTMNRHVNVTTIFLTQNLFHEGQRTCHLNAQYAVIMKMVRDVQQTTKFLSQMYTDKLKFAKRAMEDATREPYGYLLVDMRQETPQELRLRTKIFPDDWEDGYYAQRVYIPV